MCKHCEDLRAQLADALAQLDSARMRADFNREWAIEVEEDLERERADRRDAARDLGSVR